MADGLPAASRAEPNLPLFQMLCEACDIAWKNKHVLLLMYILPTSFFSIMRGIAVSNFEAGLIFDLTITFVQVLVFVPATIAWYRFILLSEKPDSIFYYFNLSMRDLNFLWRAEFLHGAVLDNEERLSLWTCARVV